MVRSLPLRLTRTPTPRNHNRVLHLLPVLLLGERPCLRPLGAVAMSGQVCAVQIGKDLAGVSAEEMEKVVIAYEPVSREV